MLTQIELAAELHPMLADTDRLSIHHVERMDASGEWHLIATLDTLTGAQGFASTVRRITPNARLHIYHDHDATLARMASQGRLARLVFA